MCKRVRIRYSFKNGSIVCFFCFCLWPFSSTNPAISWSTFSFLFGVIFFFQLRTCRLLKTKLWNKRSSNILIVNLLKTEKNQIIWCRERKKEEDDWNDYYVRFGHVVVNIKNLLFSIRLGGKGFLLFAPIFSWIERKKSFVTCSILNWEFF